MQTCNFIGCPEAATHTLRAPASVNDHGRVMEWKNEGAYCNGHTKIRVIELGNVIVMKLKESKILCPIDASLMPKKPLPFPRASRN